MDQELDLVWKSEEITEWFGYWPSFHDAEIYWIKLQRLVPVQAEGVNIELLIHTWELADLSQEKNCLIHLQFEDCQEVCLEGFNLQNVLFGLNIEMDRSGSDKSLRVTLNSSYGVQGGFVCDHIKVFGLTPCNDDGVPLTSGKFNVQVQ